MTRAIRGFPIGDIVLAVLFALVAALEATFITQYGPAWPYLLNLLIHLALVPAMLWRRRRVVPAFVAAYALLAALALLVALSPLNLGISPALVAAPLSVLAITRHGPSPRWGYAALVLGVAGSFVSPLHRAGGLSGLGVAAHVLLVVGCYLWAAQQRQLAERHARELAERSTRAVEAERAMVAREVHDIVAHNLAVVRVQSATALTIGSEDALRGALTTIKEVSDAALAETRDFVGSLRSGPEDAPSGDLGELDRLVARAREALPGLRAELPDAATLATWQTWPARTRLTVLRVTQEAATNLIRHGAGSARLAVTEQGSDVVVEAHNTARRQGNGGGGHGLVGLRERVELAGGTLEAGPEGDGFRLVARFPTRSQP